MDAAGAGEFGFDGTGATCATRLMPRHVQPAPNNIEREKQTMGFGAAGRGKDPNSIPKVERLDLKSQLIV
jgi:hypothetical protein